jgi:chromosome segregation ATPase
MIIKNLVLADFKGHNGKFDLSDRLVLSGPNGAGKSGIMDAIRILICGYTAMGKTPGVTYSLASGKACTISGTTEDGTMVSRRFERKGPGASQTITVNGAEVKDKDFLPPPSWTFPVESIHPNEFLSLSGDKRAAWLSANLSMTIGAVASDLFPEVEKILGELGYDDPVDAVMARLAEKEKLTKNEIELCTSNLRRLMGQDVQLPAGTLAEWEKTLADTDAELERLNKLQAKNEERVKLAGSKAQHITKLRDQVAQAGKKIAETSGKIAALKTQLEHLDPARGCEGLEKLRADMQADQVLAGNTASEIKRLRDGIQTIKAHGKCPTCSTPAASLDIVEDWDIQAMGKEADLEDLSAKIAKGKEQVAFLEKAQVTAAKRKELTTEIKVLTDAVTSYKQSKATYEADIEKAEADTAEASQVETPEVLTARIDGLRAQKFQAKETCQKFQASRTLANAKLQAEEDRQKGEKKQETLKTLTKSLKGARDKHLETMTGGIVGPFNTAVEKAFPGCQAFFQVIDAKGKPEVDFGIVKGGARISFETLSGGEKLAVLAALVGALQIAKTGKPSLCLLEMAEADTKRLEAVAAACDAIGFEQVVLATCQPIPNGISARWNVLQMGAMA